MPKSEGAYCPNCRKPMSLKGLTLIETPSTASAQVAAHVGFLIQDGTFAETGLEVPSAMQALWNLCLELSERLALHEKEDKSLQDLAELQGVKPLTDPSTLQMEGFDIEVPERKDA